MISTIRYAQLQERICGDVLGFENDSDNDNEIIIKPQFSGRSGQKLLELQSRFG